MEQKDMKGEAVLDAVGKAVVIPKQPGHLVFVQGVGDTLHIRKKKLQPKLSPEEKEKRLNARRQVRAKIVAERTAARKRMSDLKKKARQTLDAADMAAYLEAERTYNEIMGKE